MEERTNILSDRLLNYAAEIVKITIALRKNSTGAEIAKQLLRSGTSAGANYEEACGAQSQADFIHKMQIVLKESKESLFWLRLVQKTKLINDGNVIDLIDETKQLCNIIAKSVITAKKKHST